MGCKEKKDTVSDKINEIIFHEEDSVSNCKSIDNPLGIINGNEYIPTEKDREKIILATAYGMSRKHMCFLLGISFPTLKKHFKNELELGSDIANFTVASKLYQNAVENNNTSAQIFWLKAKAGWKESKEVVLTDDTTNKDQLEAILSKK